MSELNVLLILTSLVLVWIIFLIVINYQSRDGLALSIPLRCKWGWHGQLRYGRCFLCGTIVDDDQRPER
jgi:hypothetical protein